MTEDPEDVYRVWVGPKKQVEIRVEPTRNVDVEIWGPGTPTVYARGAKRNRFLVTGGYRKGARPEVLRVQNSDARGAFVFLDVYLPKNGPLDAGYTLRISTRRLPPQR